jgi:hypothetical protein
MKRLVEIRSYKLKAGTGGEFHRLVSSQSMPLHAAWGMDVVAFGPSVHDADAYYLIRAYDDLEHLRASQAAFYATDAWRKGPREAIIALIESDGNAVLWLSREAVDALRAPATSP